MFWDITGKYKEDAPHSRKESRRHEQQQHLDDGCQLRILLFGFFSRRRSFFDLPYLLTAHCQRPSSPASARAVSKSILSLFSLSKFTLQPPNFTSLLISCFVDFMSKLTCSLTISGKTSQDFWNLRSSFSAP